ncbi:MAG: TspO/MBR family protein [Candidatus Bathyarchaeota archaeon]
MNISNVAKLIVAIVICQLAGAVGSIFTTPSIPIWYASLQKPIFTPPNWLFAPVWITLFTLMGISAYLIWRKSLKNRHVKTALVIFDIQLILNALWSYLFFGLQSPFYGFIGIVILWIAIALTILKFYRIFRAAGLILIPYIVWVSIALSLNYYVWMFNP